jgi:hypothetical protein
VKTETEEDTRRWKDLPCSWAGRINILNTTLVSKESYKFSAIPPQNSNNILHRNRKNPKIPTETQSSQNNF